MKAIDTERSVNGPACECHTDSDGRHPVHALDKEALAKRLKRIEGQVRGVERMIVEDRYCVDILTQVAAIRAAIDKVGLILLENHTRGCVVDAIQHDRGDVAVDELMEVLHKFLD